MKVKLRVRPDCVDRRTVDLHLRADSIEEKRFALRVARNPTERERIEREPHEIKYVDDPEPDLQSWDQIQADEAGMDRFRPL
jgi:hypothetical protein